MKKKIYLFIFSKLYKLNNSLTVKLKYFLIMHHRLNLNNPKYFSEKVTWLMLFFYPESQKAIKLGDKVGLRDELTGTVLEKKLLPVIEVIDDVENFNFLYLPEKFVLKKSNASGMNAVIENKNTIDIQDLQKTMRKWMNTDYSIMAGEKHYGQMKSKIVIENFLENIQQELQIFFLNGEYKYAVQIEYKMADVSNHGYSDKKIIESKSDLDISLIEENIFSEILLPLKPIIKDLPLVRVDLIKSAGEYYLGELTFTPSSGLYPNFDRKKDLEWGHELTLPSRNNGEKLI